MTTRRRQAGALLIEALVAVALLSAALAGNALLLVQALRYEREAALRSAALRLAESLAEELRGQSAAEGVDTASILGWQATAAASLPVGAESMVAMLDAPAATYLVELSWPAAGLVPASQVRLVVEP